MSKLNRYIIEDREQSPLAEAYRTIRNSIQTAQGQEQVKTVLFVGTVPGESSMMVAANTAVALAYAGKRVAFVDFDLRKPVMHEVFGVKAVGVTDFINGSKTLEQIIQTSSIPNLMIIASGLAAGRPLTILSDVRTKQLLDELRGAADYVVINTAPLTFTKCAICTDACVLASKVDGVVVNIDTQTIRVHAAKKVLQLLQGAKARIIGTVLNNVETEEDFIYPSITAG